MQLNQYLSQVVQPPIPEVASWVAGRDFPTDRPLLDLSQAVPDYPTADSIVAHINQASGWLETGKYGDVLGLPALRDAYAEKLCRQYHGSVRHSQVAITAGCNQAFHIAASCLLEPGAEIILPQPWYFNHKMSIDMLGGRAIALPCLAENGMQPNAQQAASLINPSTRAVALISPNNPTGLEYSPECIGEFYELCKTRGIALILDETYYDFRQHPDTPAHPVFSDPTWGDTLIHLYSFSKAYALAGYRVGAVVTGEALLAQVNKVMDCIAICASQLSQQAALFGLLHAHDWLADKRRVMRERANCFRSEMQCHMATSEQPCRIAAMGAYFAYIDQPFSNSSTEAARSLAQDSNILTLPGAMFGPSDSRYLRVAFANVEAPLMPTIAARLAAHGG